MSRVIKLSKREKLTSILLFIPVIFRWMPYRPFPIVYFYDGFPYFWPSIFFLLYLLIQPPHYKTSVNNSAKKVLLVGLPLCVISLLASEDAMYSVELFIKVIFCYTLPLIFLYKPLSPGQLNYLKYLVIGLYFYVAIQAFLSATGIWQIVEIDYESDAMSFFRARTKAGDSNQTALVIVLLTILTTSYYSKRRMFNLCIIFFSFITIAMCATRGSLIVITIYLVSYLLVCLKGSPFKYKLLIIASILYGGYYTTTHNIMGDVITRTNSLSEVGNISANRDVLILGALNNAFVDSPLIGVGQGRVYPSTKDLARAHDNGLNYSKYTTAPHNYWIVVLCEYGLIGFILLLVFTIKYLKNLDYRIPISWGILGFIVVSMNTEAIIIHDEVLLFVCMMFLCRKYLKEKQYYTKKNNG